MCSRRAGRRGHRPHAQPSRDGRRGAWCLGVLPEQRAHAAGGRGAGQCRGLLGVIARRAAVAAAGPAAAELGADRVLAGSGRAAAGAQGAAPRAVSAGHGWSCSPSLGLAVGGAISLPRSDPADQPRRRDLPYRPSPCCRSWCSPDGQVRSAWASTASSAVGAVVGGASANGWDLRSGSRCRWRLPSPGASPPSSVCRRCGSVASSWLVTTFALAFAVQSTGVFNERYFGWLLPETRGRAADAVLPRLRRRAEHVLPVRRRARDRPRAWSPTCAAAAFGRLLIAVAGQRGQRPVLRRQRCAHQAPGLRRLGRASPASPAPSSPTSSRA